MVSTKMVRLCVGKVKLIVPSSLQEIGKQMLTLVKLSCPLMITNRNVEVGIYGEVKYHQNSHLQNQVDLRLKVHEKQQSYRGQNVAEEGENLNISERITGSSLYWIT